MKSSITLLASTLTCLLACGCSSSEGTTPYCPGWTNVVDLTDAGDAGDSTIQDAPPINDVCTSVYEPTDAPTE